MKRVRELRQNGMNSSEQLNWLLSGADQAAEFIRLFPGITI